MCVCVSVYHFAAHPKLAYCKATVLQFLKKDQGREVLVLW